MTNLYNLSNDLTMAPIYYSIHLHLNNIVAFTSRVEVEAAIVLFIVGSKSKNTGIRNVLHNLEHTYGPLALVEAAQLMGFCTLDKVA